MSPVYCLGINAFLHDSAAAILRDGELLAFAEEERFTRVRHSGRFPEHAIAYCLAEAGIEAARVDRIGFAWNPWRGLPRRFLGAWHHLATGPRRLGGQWEKWREVRSVPNRCAALGFRAPVRFLDHHRCHAAAVFLPSPFDRALVAVVDGAGEIATTSWLFGDGNRLEALSHVEYPHSIGLFYAAVTEWLGFHHNADEGKVMGLAPWGRDRYVREMSSLIKTEGMGSVRVDLDYFDFGARWWTPRFESLFGPARRPREAIESRHEDVAFAVQAITERVTLAAFSAVHEALERAGRRLDSLAFTGGVALNSVLNGRIVKETPFRELFLIPNGNDSGTAWGAALLADLEIDPRRERRPFPGVALGPAIRESEIVTAARQAGLSAERIGEAVVARAARALAEEQVGGWCQGRMETGPRALGQRSILADPRRAEMKDTVNRRIKKREPFRPFGPSIPLECAARLVEIDGPSPHMLKVFPATAEGRQLCPAAIHVDGTARIQTVSPEENRRFHALLAEFGRLTGVPALLNTSLNVAGEPITCGAGDAIRTFVEGSLDFLVIDDFWIQRREPGESDRREPEELDRREPSGGDVS